ncbi:MAG: hypothetical protein RLZZ454_1849 [Pseudomonadota bacterium]
MRRTIIDRQVAAMTANGYDAFISCSPENYAYATGFVVPSHPLIRHRHAMVIVTADAKVELFSVDMEASTVKRNAPGVPTSIWAEFSDDPMQVLASQLTNMGLASGHLGIEFDYLPAGDLARLPASTYSRACVSSRLPKKSRYCAASRGLPIRLFSTH